MKSFQELSKVKYGKSFIQAINFINKGNLLKL